MAINSKKQLAVILSKLEDFLAAGGKSELKLEQYSTPSEIAADWLWNMANLGDVASKVIVDLACGPGFLGLGALLLGAKKVYFVDKSKEAMEICKRNYNKLKEEFDIVGSEFIVGDVTDFNVPVDVVIQNPPFGTKVKHIDKLFLEKAFSVSKIVWSMHKLSTTKFVEAMAKDYNFLITHHWKYDFMIKKKFSFHRKPKVFVEVGLWRMEKQ
ncbi:METTL5 family protein [Candidatus Woesearchaeota archaeon]|nr:METTL5 family protein [Candidatus Woesearchaeota archaeon]